MVMARQTGAEVVSGSQSAGGIDRQVSDARLREMLIAED
jgi:hypothetical protein